MGSMAWPDDIGAQPGRQTKTWKTGQATLHIDVVIDCVDINDFKIQVCQLNLVRQAERQTPG